MLYSYFLLKIFYSLEKSELFNFQLAFSDYTKVKKLSIKYKDNIYRVDSIFLNECCVEEMEKEHLDFHFKIDNKDIELIYSKLDDKFIVKSKDASIIKLFELDTYDKLNNGYFGSINKQRVIFNIDGAEYSC